MLSLAFICLSCFLNLVGSISKHPSVLVVSFDAFRYDFLNKSATPNLYALSQIGVRADYIRNIFPTKTFPNHFSIGTGVYAEDHGVLANHVFYNNRSHGYSYDLFHYNDDVVPIWTLNEKAGQGRHSGSMMWPGGEFAYQGVTPTHAVRYDQSFDWNKRVDVAISWFLNETAPANLVMLYFEEPDFIGHRHGVDDPLFRDEIRHCDRTAKYLQDQLEAHNLHDKVNVFLLSDHGMVSVAQDRIIDLNKFANFSRCDVVGTSPVMQISALASLDPFAKRSVLNKTFGDLKFAERSNGHFKVYMRDDIPDKFNYKHNSRVSDILAVADVNYAFQDLYKTIEYYRTKENQTITPSSEFGVHGYSNFEPSMFPFFTAHGPALKRNVTVPPFDNVDLYPLFAYILRLPLPHGTPRYQLRGTLDHVSSMLAASMPSFGLSTLTIELLSFVLFMLMLCASVIALSFWNNMICRRNNPREGYERSGPAEERESLIKVAPSTSDTANLDSSSNTFQLDPSELTVETRPLDLGSAYDVSNSLLPR